MKRFWLLLIALLVGNETRADDDCAPSRMLHTRTSVRAAGFKPEDFAAQPKDLYRYGSKLGRLEEVPDMEQRIHALVVVNGADVWMANLLSAAGQHIVDPGPTIAFRAPILAETRDDYWSRFEFGCEVRFMTDRGVDGVRTQRDGDVTYSHEYEGVRVVLTTNTEGVPQKVAVSRPDMAFEILYGLYEYRDLDPALFEKLSGIEFVEADP